MEKEVIIKEAIEKMKECVNNGDTEGAHINGDGVLGDVLTQLGYKELVDLYEKVKKWYA